MNRRKLIDVEMEQTGEAARSPSYEARQANSNTSRRRMAMSSVLNKASGVSQFNPYPTSSKVNPATGQSWFEAPSPEYQAYEMNRGNQGLKDRQTKFDQDVNLEKRILTELEPMANNEKNRALGMELATRLPYATFEKSADLFGGAKTLASVMPSFDTLRYQKGVAMSL